MVQKQPNWVAERAKCDITRLFEDIHALAKQDLGWAMIEEEKRHSGVRYEQMGEFSSSTYRLRRFVAGVEKSPCTFHCRSIEKPPCVEVVYGTDGSGVLGTYKITTRWNAAEYQCLIVVEDPKNGTLEFPHHELWKALHYILEPFFFPTKGDD